MERTDGVTLYEGYVTRIISNGLKIDGYTSVRLGKSTLLELYGSMTVAFESIVKILDKVGRLSRAKFQFKTDPGMPSYYRIEWERD